jgi:hypothetical protein
MYDAGKGVPDIVRLREELAALMTSAQVVEAQRLARKWNEK